MLKIRTNKEKRFRVITETECGTLIDRLVISVYCRRRGILVEQFPISIPRPVSGYLRVLWIEKAILDFEDTNIYGLKLVG